MAEQVLTDAEIFFGQYDISSDSNTVAVSNGAEVLDTTGFGNTTRTRKGGVKTSSVSLEGKWNTVDIDDAFFSNIAVSDVPMTIANLSAEGSQAFALKTILAEYSPSGSFGELLTFSCNAEARSDLIRGELLINKTATVTGAGTDSQLGAVSAAQSVYGALHVFAASGSSPTLDVIVESDDNSGFTSATTRLTFTQATAETSEWLSLAGAITDDWWRISYTIGGGTPSFTFAVFLGIQ